MINKIIKVSLIMAVLLISMGFVSADGNFTHLRDEIQNSTNVFEITQDYAYDNASDESIFDGVPIFGNDNLTINGNGHVLNGNNQMRIFYIGSDNVVINNLTLINAFSAESGGAIFLSGSNLTLNNVIFKNNFANDTGGAIFSMDLINIDNAKFIDNAALNEGSAIYMMGSCMNVNNSDFSSSNEIKKGLISSKDAVITIDNCIFLNTTSQYATAVFSDNELIISNSKFINLSAKETGGAIISKAFLSISIRNSTFINTKANKDGGAIYADEYMEGEIPYFSISGSQFINSTAEFGGAICTIEGSLYCIDSNFINNSAHSGGGAIFASDCYMDFYNVSFIENSAFEEESFGGAIYVDYQSVFNADHLVFINNSAKAQGDAIYAYQRNRLSIFNSTFKDNQAIYSTYDAETVLSGNSFINSSLKLNQSDYATIIIEEGLKLNIINNTINYTDLPSKFDSRDFGWVSSVKNQGSMGACWAFGALSSLESSILKATGIEYDFSENNMQNIMLKYSKYGFSDAHEGARSDVAIKYLISWLGTFPAQYDSYDEYGKLSPLFSTNESFHVQDVIMIPVFEEMEYMDDVKKAIIECGAVSSSFSAFTDNFEYYNPSTAAFYRDEFGMDHSHAISIVGWDDNYSKDNFEITPQGDGAWIVKNSWGSEWGDNGFFYISFYDATLFYHFESFAFLIENTENYTKNYQTEISGYLNPYLFSFGKYYNRYESLGEDLIAGVGTYFEDSGIDFTIDVYVNDELKLTQNETSKFRGFATIKLNEYIPIKTNDNFTVMIGGNRIPVTDDSRTEFEAGNSFMYADDQWVDLYSYNTTACLKVYTIANPIITNDLVKMYKNQSQFEADVGIANASVNFTINGVIYTRISNESGIAKININLEPGNYTISTAYDGFTVKNMITVLSAIQSNDLVKYFRNASQFDVKVLDDGLRNVTFNINGVFYTREINENRMARLNINLAQGEYIITTTNPLTGENVANNITVLSLIESHDLVKYYRNDSQFLVKIYNATSGNVRFNINGVFYTREINESGEAKLNINLEPGEYIITSEYNGCMVSNNITVLNTLILNYEYNESIVYVSPLIKVLDGKGNNFANQKVQINIGGIFYELASNSMGDVEMYRLNLQKGKYFITAYCNEASVSGEIRIIGDIMPANIR